MIFQSIIFSFIILRLSNTLKIVDENGLEANEQKHHVNKKSDEIFKFGNIKSYILMLEYKNNCTSTKNDYKVIRFNDSSIGITEKNFTETDAQTAFNYFKTDECISSVLYDPITNEEVAEDMDSIMKDFPEIDEEDVQVTPMYITDKKMNIEKFQNETNYRGKDMTIHYIDGGFYEHEDINNAHFNKEFKCTSDINCNHGVWSLGILGASNNNIGFVGIVPEAKVILYGAHQLTDILKNAKSGDIVGASMALTLNNTADMPLFCLNSNWKIFEELLNRNVAVLVSAGNKNIDISKYELCDRNDTRVVVSTGCHNISGKKLGFSSYNYKGSMFCNWGINVQTTGPSTLNDRTNGEKSYFSKYSGTSSSNPINTALFALLQGYSKKNGFLLSLNSMVKIFNLTSKQYSTKNVGKQIDLYEAYKFVKDNIIGKI